MLSVLYEDVMEDCTKRLATIKINCIHCSPHVQSASHLIFEGYHVGQAQFPSHKFMLTTPNQFLFLHMFGNGLFPGVVASWPFPVIDVRLTSL